MISLNDKPHIEKSVEFLLNDNLPSNITEHCPAVLIQPTLVSVVIESSGHENATILASRSDLMSPSTSRLNTIPGTTSELWTPAPLTYKEVKKNVNQICAASRR